MPATVAVAFIGDAVWVGLLVAGICVAVGFVPGTAGISFIVGEAVGCLVTVGVAVDEAAALGAA